MGGPAGEMQAEVDRTMVVSGLNYLEKKLDNLIQTYLVLGSQDLLPENESPLNNKIDMANSLNLLTLEEYHDLRSLEAVFGLFSIEPSGIIEDESEISARCQELYSSKITIPFDLEKTWRPLYRIAVNRIGNRLISRTNCIKMSHCISF
ncbi:MAG: hypothetical protein HPY50_13985 [Firmicutes bacterium]|nr:hypothetical protein [Bacillota bacterium]